MSQKLVDGSRLLVEGTAKAGVDVYSGYPITPVNRVYFHAVERIPTVLKAPDEITALQWASGLAATGKLAMTGTSRPGFSLMIETLDMAFMMELPLMIAIAQRLGPSTGSATTGAQGDLGALNQLISGGYNVPVLSPSNLEDCYFLANEALHIAVKLRTPVVLLTSKEMIETERSLDVARLPQLERVEWDFFHGDNFLPYDADGAGVPDFLPVGDDNFQVRLTASTHGKSGELKKATEDSMKNTARLYRKIEGGMADHCYLDLDEQKEADSLVVSYGITSYAAREAVEKLRREGEKVSLLLVKTLLPVPSRVYEVVNNYCNVVIAEENLMGQYKEILFGGREIEGVRNVNAIGRMITPDEIVSEAAQGEL